MNDVTERPNSLPWPPIIYLAAIAISFLLGVFSPLPWFAQPLSGILSAIGWLMIAAFVALNISAIRAMRPAGTTVKPDRGTDHLVMEGPFSFTRNPLYLAGTTLLLGIGLVSGIVWFLLLAVLAAFAFKSSPSKGRKGIFRRDSGGPMWITPSVCGGGSRVMCAP